MKETPENPSQISDRVESLFSGGCRGTIPASTVRSSKNVLRRARSEGAIARRSRHYTPDRRSRSPSAYSVVVAYKRGAHTYPEKSSAALPSRSTLLYSIPLRATLSRRGARNLREKTKSGGIGWGREGCQRMRRERGKEKRANER